MTVSFYNQNVLLSYSYLLYERIRHLTMVMMVKFCMLHAMKYQCLCF